MFLMVLVCIAVQKRDVQHVLYMFSLLVSTITAYSVWFCCPEPDPVRVHDRYHRPFKTDALHYKGL